MKNAFITGASGHLGSCLVRYLLKDNWMLTVKEEFLHFIESITSFQKPDTDGKSATEALELGLKIQNIIENK